MKYISKNPEPAEFSEWKKQQKLLGVNFSYQSFQKPEKTIVKQSLLSEQGYICCYCCRQINQDNSHIEHLSPQSKTDDNLALDYANMLASCGPYDLQEQQEQQNLGKKRQLWPKHCGNFRKNDFLPISPLEKDCETYFAYTGVGEIIPVNEQLKAHDTIKILGLNDAELILKRRGVFDGILDGIEDLTRDDVQKIVEYYQNLDNNGHYQPFCVAIIYFLKQYFTLD